MNTVNFKGLECEVSIDGADIQLYSIAEGCTRVFVLPRAGYALKSKAKDAVSYRDVDEDGAYWTYYESDVDEWIDNNVDEFIDSWAGEVLEVTENLN